MTIGLVVSLAVSTLVAFVSGWLGLKLWGSLRRMLASGSAHPPLDWREFFGPRREVRREDNPVVYGIHVAQTAWFTAITMSMALGLLLMIGGTPIVVACVLLRRAIGI